MTRRSKCKPRKTYPASADFALHLIIDRETGDIGDDEETLYFTSLAVPDEDMWREVAEDIADGDQLLEFTAKAVSQGRYWDYDDTETTVTWSCQKV